jgi:hypothetical protein
MVVGGIFLDQSLRAISEGYEDASCTVKAGEGLTVDYCEYFGSTEPSIKRHCFSSVTCCDYPVMVKSNIQPVNLSSADNLTMRARACSASDPCGAFYKWLKTATAQITSNPQSPSLSIPCKYNSAKLNKSDEDSYCGMNTFHQLLSVGPLLAGEGWCCVLSTTAEYPTIRDLDALNQRLKPLWIFLILLGPLFPLAAGLSCYLSTRQRTPPPAPADTVPAAPHSESHTRSGTSPQAPRPQTAGMAQPAHAAGRAPLGLDPRPPSSSI